MQRIIVAYALIDDDDYKIVGHMKWHLTMHGYAEHSFSKGKCDRTSIGMHKFIINTPDNMETDHINGDKLDNRRCNLRIVTSQQNKFNHKDYTRSDKNIRAGVYWEKSRCKWKVIIGLNYKRINIGRFDNYVDAVASREEAEKKYFGQYARSVND